LDRHVLVLVLLLLPEELLGLDLGALRERRHATGRVRAVPEGPPARVGVRGRDSTRRSRI
jgi:hypothetical protein